MVKNYLQILPNLIWRFPQYKSSQKHIFVVGAPRSGTTLLKLVLDSHSKFISPGHETGFFLYNKIISNNWNFENFKPEEIQKLKQESNNIVSFFDELVQKNLEIYNGEYFVEKSPPHILHLKFLRKHFPNSYFIHIYRDGRDCYCSARSHPHIPQNKSLEKYAYYWRNCIRTRFKEREDGNIFDLKYEELVEEPEKNIKALMKFLNEEFEEEQLNFHKSSSHRLVKNPVERFIKLTKNIDNKSVTRYLQELTTAEIEKFNKIAEKELGLLGYTID